MTNPQYPGDPQNPYGQQQGNQWEAQPQQPQSSWEQSQPTGNVWNQQANDAWGQQPPTAPQTPGVGFQAPVSSTDAKGFFSALFDFSFDTYITPKVIKLVYIVYTVIVALFLLVSLITPLVQGEIGIFVGVLLIGPVVAVLGLALFRITLEMYHAIVRVSEDVHHRLPRA